MDVHLIFLAVILTPRNMQSKVEKLLGPGSAVKNLSTSAGAPGVDTGSHGEEEDDLWEQMDTLPDVELTATGEIIVPESPANLPEGSLHVEDVQGVPDLGPTQHSLEAEAAVVSGRSQSVSQS